MSEPFYRTNVNVCHRLNLVGREAMVYMALLYLCNNGVYSGTDEALASFSCCGDRHTAGRIVKSLRKKGLVCTNEEGIWLVQNEPNSVQNEPSVVQNAPKQKEEKENQKKKENIKERMSVRNTDAHAPTLVFDPNKVFEPPYWNEWEAFGKTQGIEQAVYKKAWCYYMMRGWEGVREWKAALLYWDLKNKT